MDRIVIKKYIRNLFLLAFALFITNKFYLRPWVLERNLPEIFNVVVLSLPNFIEAIMGTILIAGILTKLKFQRRNYFKNLSESYLYLIASIIASFYVILQELKFHNIGGNNFYDPYDVIASIFGLIFIYVILNKFGLIETKPNNLSEK